MHGNMNVKSIILIKTVQLKNTEYADPGYAIS